jgi:cytochrome c553
MTFPQSACFQLRSSRLALLLALTVPAMVLRAEPIEEEDFEKKILPILEDHCYSCHGDGADKGKVSFDNFGSTAELLKQTELWVHVLKNVRSGVMPPARKKRLDDEEIATLESWIKRTPLQLDPLNPDPGRVTLRRLNRVEYRNTIRDLMGIDFRTDEEFPADDTGYGFDNIGDVLTTSPLLLEKYMQAAEVIVSRAVPLENRITPQIYLPASVFTRKHGSELSISLYDPADLSASVDITQAGTYRVVLNANVRGSFAFDPGRANAEWFVDGKRVFQEELKWESGKKLDASVEVKWSPGRYPLRMAIEPRVGKDQKPAGKPGDGPPNVDLIFYGATIIGPLEPEFAKRPDNYHRFFTREEVPADNAERMEYAREIIRRFTYRAFRRPADETTVAKLASLAMESAQMPGGTFERGIARALTAVIASPRFLFRIEEALEESSPEIHPRLDEFSLASRLSYFLWSTMPDEALLQLAERGELRKNLSAQIHRMLKDEKSAELVKNFAGQWLQTRDVESVSIDARIVLARDAGQEKDLRLRYQYRERLNREIDQAEQSRDVAKLEKLQQELAEFRRKFSNGGRRIEFGNSLRTAMRREAEMLFQHVLNEDRSVLELVNNDSTFLNQELATHYGIPGVQGREMRLVKLPPESPRGGILTMGTVLAVTSNPTRTSPVKRGLFILDNILGTPPPPAPPNIPSLEASEKSSDGNQRTLREALALHREQPLCSSCHNRMDPLGLALENFNAMGSWRDQELGQPIESPAGKLITGEAFADVRELKHLIVTARRKDYYQCITEKLLTYALGRGPQPCDISTVDSIVDQLEANHGKFSTLLIGIIESPAFQKRHRNKP